MNFHIKRRTGELSRKLERGTSSISMVFRAVVFTFIPTALELALVCGILWRQFSAPVAGECRRKQIDEGGKDLHNLSFATAAVRRCCYYVFYEADLHHPFHRLAFCSISIVLSKLPTS
jgi:hypothetical protein